MKKKELAIELSIVKKKQPAKGQYKDEYIAQELERVFKRHGRNVRHKSA